MVLVILGNFFKMITVVTDSRPLDVSPSLTIVLKKIVSTTDTNMDFTTDTMDITDTAIIETTLDH